MSSEMIERVARALCVARVERNTGGKWDQSEPPEWAMAAVRDDARAAILALREPTPEMVEAADLSDRLMREDYRSVWSAMIDTALGDGG